MPELTPSERLRRAGLDPDLPVGQPTDEPALASARYCPYTGRELLITVDAPGGEATARRGVDAFTSTGQILRYSPGGGHVEVVTSPTAPRAHRETVDLLAASCLPLPELAVRASSEEPVVERLQVVAPGMGEVASLVVRHGRLYALASFAPQQHVLQAWRVPSATAAQGWRAPRIRGTLAPFQDYRPGTELRVSDTLAYVNLVEHLGAWHIGTGDHLIEWAWPSSTGVPLVRIAHDRMLLVREEPGGQVAEVYDLAEVAAGPCRPLPGQALRLGPVPASDAQPAWAEACGPQFVVVGAEGHVFVFPFDGAPYEPFGNAEGLTLGPPRFTQEAGLPTLVAFVRSERGRWLLRVPLDPQQPYRFDPLHERTLASYDLAPCLLGSRLFSADTPSEENLQVVRGAEDTVGGVERVTEVAGTAGARLYDFQLARVRGRELLWIDHGQSTRRQWVATPELAKVDLDPPFPQLRVQDSVMGLWDAGGLYLCDLTDGVVYLRSPQ